MPFTSLVAFYVPAEPALSRGRDSQVKSEMLIDYW